MATLISNKTGDVHEIVDLAKGQPVTLCDVIFPISTLANDDLLVTCPRCLAIQSEIS